MNRSEETRRVTPGMIAILLMGWLELLTSVVMYRMDIVPVAVVFAVISVLLTFLATQVRRTPWQDPPMQAETAPQTIIPAPIARIMPIITAVLALASLIGAVIQLLSGQGLAAVLFACWTISLAIQSVRLWPHK